MNKTIITTTLNKRPDYTQKALDAIAESLSWSKLNFPKMFFIDYANDKVVSLAEQFKEKYDDTTIVINDPPLGCNNNTYTAINTALRIENFDRVIHFEDDTIPTKDCIDFFVRHMNLYDDNPNVFSITGYNRTVDFPDVNEMQHTEKQNHFTCWGICLWKKKSDVLLDNWIKDSDHTNKTMSWDSHLNDNVVTKDENLLQVKPMISRIQNIGSEGGSWVPSPMWHFYNHRSPFTSNDIL